MLMLNIEKKDFVIIKYLNMDKNKYADQLIEEDKRKKERKKAVF